MASLITPILVDDGFNEYEITLQCQKSSTSKVWGEMTKLECEKKHELKAQCNHYKSIFSAKSSNGTSHLRRHLNSYLKIFNKDITQYTIATQPSLGDGLSIKTYKFDVDECHVSDYWGQWDKDYQIFVFSDEEWSNTLCKPFLAILNLLFDEYVKNSKSMSSSLAESSNVSDNDPIDSSLH
ncbi:hypothetical protein Gogos_019359 [Gossypium gossypioides]|uniref:BED-type domain-containing protein n=1 Tax=Gossypium gossypioides TaxID=34282 RepID=A0A7J9BH53_GOSGO|nr:hypothetical protein [Gossypium gossypioides]